MPWPVWCSMRCRLEWQAGGVQGGAGGGLSIPAQDDRVNSVDYSIDYSDYYKLPLGFSKLDKDTSRIVPFNYVSW